MLYSCIGEAPACSCYKLIDLVMVFPPGQNVMHKNSQGDIDTERSDINDVLLIFLCTKTIPPGE